MAPLGQLIRNLRCLGCRGALSLELFNRDLWRQDALSVVRVGLEKRHAVVRQSLKGERTEWWRHVGHVPPPF